MRKSLIWALSLIALCVLFFIFTDGKTTVEFFSYSWKLETSIALLGFTGIGIVIGALLK
ncbi:hypothetical protein [Tichowtungia aerotolerans]|uniref:Uncharacterized protein n=1 Tax=Tichowtungia aerotolerans TaxID=2697043 RepID=A0A6P1M776_9BACT|nr:hypothetical protein [Tichowtungia aerotolerans]QHI69882.1 hypothetical protein GT409_10610 [Tichowtungia aerotolerans]